MKKYSLLLVALLAGCGTVDKAMDAYFQKFDANEYKLITDIRTNAGLAKLDCVDSTKSRKNVERIWVSALSLKNYAENLPHNKPMQQATVDLYEMVKGLSDKYDAGPVSSVFCKIKYKNIEDSASVMQKSEGNKPK